MDNPELQKVYDEKLKELVGHPIRATAPKSKTSNRNI
jgi:hypothetical protein